MTTDEAAEWAEQCGFRGAMVFLDSSTGELPEDLALLIENAHPDDLSAVMSLLRALPRMPDVTRRTVLAMLDTVGASTETPL